MGLSEGRHNKNSRVMGTASKLAGLGALAPRLGALGCHRTFEGNTAAPILLLRCLPGHSLLPFALGGSPGLTKSGHS